MISIGGVIGTGLFLGMFVPKRTIVLLLTV
jgi:hypothetical protein